MLISTLQLICNILTLCYIFQLLTTPHSDLSDSYLEIIDYLNFGVNVFDWLITDVASTLSIVQSADRFLKESYLRPK